MENNFNVRREIYKRVEKIYKSVGQIVKVRSKLYYKRVAKVTVAGFATLDIYKCCSRICFTLKYLIYMYIKICNN